MSTHSAHSRKTSSTLFHYSPLSTISSTLFHYAPLSSTTSIWKPFYHPTTFSHSISTPICSSLPASTSQSDSSLASSSSAPLPTNASGPDQSVIPDSEIYDPSMGLTVVVLTLLAILMIMTVIIWWTEIHACEDSRNADCQKGPTLSQTRGSEPVGLGITIQPTKEGRKETSYQQRMRCWLVQSNRRARFADMVGRWTDSAVAMLRAELDTDAEQGLLLSVQASERSKREKGRIEIRVDSDRKC
jgi:hypothetical protein